MTDYEEQVSALVTALKSHPKWGRTSVEDCFSTTIAGYVIDVYERQLVINNDDFVVDVVELPDAELHRQAMRIAGNAAEAVRSIMSALETLR